MKKEGKELLNNLIEDLSTTKNIEEVVCIIRTKKTNRKKKDKIINHFAMISDGSEREGIIRAIDVLELQKAKFDLVEHYPLMASMMHSLQEKNNEL